MTEADAGWIQLVLWLIGVALAAGIIVSRVNSQSKQIEELTKRFDEFEDREAETTQNATRMMQALLGITGNGGVIAEMNYHRALHHWYANCLQLLASEADLELPNRPQPIGLG